MGAASATDDHTASFSRNLFEIDLRVKKKINTELYPEATELFRRHRIRKSTFAGKNVARK